MAENGGKFTYFLAGIGIGTLIGVLFAPKAGDETRDYLAARAGEGTDYLKRKGREVREQADAYLAKGKEVLQRQRENVEAAIEAGKQAYQEASSQATGAPPAPDAKPAGSEG